MVSLPLLLTSVKFSLFTWSAVCVCENTCLHACVSRGLCEVSRGLCERRVPTCTIVRQRHAITKPYRTANTLLHPHLRERAAGHIWAPTTPPSDVLDDPEFCPQKNSLMRHETRVHIVIQRCYKTNNTICKTNDVSLKYSRCRGKVSVKFSWTYVWLWDRLWFVLA